MRSDTERNRRQLIKAAARLFESSPTQVSLADIAKQAEVSTATAYRHFSSIQEILHAFRSQVGSELCEFSARQTTTGMVKLEAVSRYWVSLVLEHGGAMAQMRSHRGYLERLREGTGYLAPRPRRSPSHCGRPPRNSGWAISGTRPSTCGTPCSTPATSSTSSRADERRTRPPPAWSRHSAAPSSAGPRRRTRRTGAPAEHLQVCENRGMVGGPDAVDRPAAEPPYLVGVRPCVEVAGDHGREAAPDGRHRRPGGKAAATTGSTSAHASALDDVDRESAPCRLLVLDLHVGAGVLHGLDDLVE